MRLSSHRVPFEHAVWAYHAEIAYRAHRILRPHIAQQLAPVLLVGIRFPSMQLVPPLVAALLMISAIVFAWRRVDTVRVETLTVAVPDTWALGHHCRAITHLLANAPDLRLVDIYLGDHFLADATNIALLIYARDRLSDADVRLSISAPATVGAMLVTKGLPTVIRGAMTQAPPREAMPN